MQTRDSDHLLAEQLDAVNSIFVHGLCRADVVRIPSATCWTFDGWLLRGDEAGRFRADFLFSTFGTAFGSGLASLETFFGEVFAFPFALALGAPFFGLSLDDGAGFAEAATASSSESLSTPSKATMFNRLLCSQGWKNTISLRLIPRRRTTISFFEMIPSCHATMNVAYPQTCFDLGVQVFCLNLELASVRQPRHNV